ncbi:MAG TPA: class I SAM-dependent methyltransferase [Gemmatimonadaceae bacterium]
MTSISTLQSLAHWVDAQPVLLGAEWIRSLERRKRDEADFHDAERSVDDERQAAHGSNDGSNERFYVAAEPVRSYVKAWIENTVPQKTFLDYACGNGGRAIEAALAGAELAVGIDISAVSVHNAARDAERAGVTSRTRFLQRDCEATGFPDDSFDSCLCSGMLHHLDLTRAFPELHRLMAPSGRVFCLEALGYNPVIQWYRNRTPQLRTAWEKDHILTLREVAFAQRWFRVENIRFHLLTAPAAVLAPAPLRKVAIDVGHTLDKVLTRIPFLQRWSWMFTFELVKR